MSHVLRLRVRRIAGFLVVVIAAVGEDLRNTADRRSHGDDMRFQVLLVIRVFGHAPTEGQKAPLSVCHRLSFVRLLAVSAAAGFSRTREFGFKSRTDPVYGRKNFPEGLELLRYALSDDSNFVLPSSLPTVVP